MERVWPLGGGTLDRPSPRRQWWDTVRRSVAGMGERFAVLQPSSSVSSSDAEEPSPYSPRFGPPAASAPQPRRFYTDEFASLHHSLGRKGQKVPSLGPFPYASPRPPRVPSELDLSPSAFHLSFESELPRVWPDWDESTSPANLSSPIPVDCERLPLPSEYANLPPLLPTSTPRRPRRATAQIYANVTGESSESGGSQAMEGTVPSSFGGWSLGRRVRFMDAETASAPSSAGTICAEPAQVPVAGGTIDRSRAKSFRKPLPEEDPTHVYASVHQMVAEKKLPALPHKAAEDSLLDSSLLQRLKVALSRSGAEEKKRRWWLNAGLAAVFFILLALLLLHLVPKLFAQPKLITPTLVFTSPKSSARLRMRPNASPGLKGVYHYKSTGASSVFPFTPATPKKMRGQDIQLPAVSLELLTPAVSPQTPNSAPTPAPSTSSLAPSTWLPVFPADVVCEENQFKCPSGRSRQPCLWEWERCDGIQDCSDGSDEDFCAELACYGNFQCQSGGCVSLAKACDGVPDCLDASDEENCTDFQCKPYELRCASGFCIPQEWRCDGEADCPGHEDESRCSDACDDGQFRCPEGFCIDAHWRCNGVSDCLGGEDEEGCPACEGPASFQCLSSAGCLDRAQLCDGTADCADGSDEWECVRSLGGGVVEARALGGDWSPVCGDLWDRRASDAVCRALGSQKSLSHLIHPASAHQTFSTYLELAALSKEAPPRLPSSLRSIARSQCRTGMVAVRCAAEDCGVWHPSDAAFTEDGAPHVRRVKRVVGGSVAGASQWPSVGLLLHAEKTVACTVSVLSPTTLLTSALCVTRTDKDPGGWHALLGSAQPNSSAARDQVVHKRPAAFLRHPNYKFHRHFADWDVLVVTLDSPVTQAQGWGERVAPICLPSETSNRVQDRGAPSHCFAAGWGFTTPGGYFLNTQLRHLQMRVEDGELCNSDRHYRGLLHPQRQICAVSADGGSRPCFGDEGAPLMCLDSRGGGWELRGLLSAHACAAQTQRPAVFADVAHVASWIRHILRSRET